MDTISTGSLPTEKIMEDKENQNEEGELDGADLLKKKGSSCLLIIGGDDSNTSQKENGDASLQDSFRKFRQQKMQEHRLMKMCREASLKDGRTPEFKENLRMKFINQAKKYLGVPYGIRFKKPEDPVAPLYLDCCGLVRKVLQDLQMDFGFVIGKWNQAYQMDTLPIVLTEKELKPGDLIFYEGTYVNEKSKPQKHDNVHVEIFIGGETGEATIGSRYHRGNVSIFPSYKFHSTSWNLKQHHFRSLETWLDGECRSHCPEHAWHCDSMNYVEAAGKRSIFSDEHDEDVSAGGEDIEDDGQLPGENAAAARDEDDEDEEDMEGGGDDDVSADEVETSPPPLAAAEAVAEETVDLSAPLASESVEIKDKQPQRAGKIAAAAGKKAGPQGASAAIKDANKSEKSEKIASRRRRSVGSLPGSSIKGSEKSAGDAVGDSTKSSAQDSSASAKRPKRVSKYRSSSDGVETLQSPTSSSKKNSGGGAAAAATATDRRELSKSLSEIDMKNSRMRDFSRTYYVNKTNGWRMVRDALDKRGWTQLPFDFGFSNRYGLKWVERRVSIDYVAHMPGQLVCHLPNNDIITTKIGLYSTLKDKFCRAPPGVAAPNHPPWLPHTYDLECPADCNALIQEEERLLAGGSNDHNAEQQAKSESGGGIWIYKPSCKNRGRGIRVISGMDSLKELCYGKPMGSGGADAEHVTTLPYKGIVQKYITDPLLVMEEGYKFDIRCYLLIARNFPTTLAFYSPGYVRLALKPYSLDSLDDCCAHLTNASVQKKENPAYLNNKDIQVQSMEDIADVLDRMGQGENAEFIRSGQLDHQIKLCLVDVMKASNHLFLRKHGYFDLLGCDFMMSKSNKVSLLEINTNPALTLDNAALARLLPVVVDGAIDLVLKSQGPDRRVGAPDDFLESDMPPGYSLIYNEGAGYMYREKRRRRKSKQGTADSAADAAKGEAVQSPADRAENENDALNQSVNSAELMESSVEED